MIRYLVVLALGFPSLLMARDEISESSGPAGPSPLGISDSLKTLGPGGGAKGGTPTVIVDGCTKELGRFQFRYQGDPKKCTEVQMAEDYADFANRTLNKCMLKAAKISSFEVGHIVHNGVMGDQWHKAKDGGRSLHNYASAIDIKEVHIDSRSFVYDSKEPDSEAFFAELRSCWGTALVKERPCLPEHQNKMPKGTLGREHVGHPHHVHLSLPRCCKPSKKRTCPRQR